MNNSTKMIFYDFVAAKTNVDESYPLEELFFDEAIAKVAEKNDMDVADVEKEVYLALAEIKGLEVSGVVNSVDNLRTERKESLRKAEDWKESLMAEREIIDKQRKIIGTILPR